MRKLILGMMLLCGALSANAVSLAFKFDVTSSGNSMYACNAGLKHANPAGRVCYERETLQACVPSACKTGEACNCVCTGGFTLPDNQSDDGEYRLDYMKASYADWTDNGVAPTNIQSLQTTAAQSGFNTVVNANQFSKQLTHLEFFLGSERYGAEYFVDICFRATQIDYPMPNTYANGDKLSWSIDRGVTITDLSSALGTNTPVWDLETNGVQYSMQKYADLAGLQVESTLLCKDKDQNVVINNNVAEVANFANGQQVKFSNKTTQADLKGCVVRYSFKETNVLDIASVRKWKAQKARICTYTSVNENE